MEWKQRVVYNKPPASFDTARLSMAAATAMFTDEQIRTGSLNRHHRWVQQKLTDMIGTHIDQAEAKFIHCRNLFHSELDSVWRSHRASMEGHAMPKVLTDLIELRFVNITDKWRAMYIYRETYYIRTSHGDSEAMRKMQQEGSLSASTFAPCLITDATHSLNEKQVQLLGRGPTYVPPCQLWVSSPLSSTDDTLTKKKWGPLKRQMAGLFSKYRINIALSMEIQEKISDRCRDLFAVLPSSELRRRALDENALVRSIRHSLTRNKLILRRTADNMNRFYVGHRHAFEEKCNAYLEKNDAYNVLLVVDEQYHEHQRHPYVKEMVDSMNMVLENLYRRKAIAHDLLTRFYIDASTIQIPYLYFLPHCQDDDICVVPIISTYRGPTWKLARYLNRMLRPLVDRVIRTTTFLDETDFARKLRYHCQTQHRLSSTTLFAAVRILNFHTMVSHESMTEMVGYFLTDHLSKNKLDEIPITSIQNLVQLVLYNNHFFYDGRVYACTKGGPTTIGLIDTLADIYLYEWQKLIMEAICVRQEFFGR